MMLHTLCALAPVIGCLLIIRAHVLLLHGSEQHGASAERTADFHIIWAYGMTLIFYVQHFSEELNLLQLIRPH